MRNVGVAKKSPQDHLPWLRRAALRTHTVRWLFALFLSAAFCRAEETPRAPLSTVMAILAAPPSALQSGLEVQFRAVITYYKPGKVPDLMVQDDSGNGIYVRVPETTPNLERNQVVQVHGKTTRGSFAPEVIADTIEVVGVSALLEPRAVDLMEISRLKDGDDVQIEGVVRGAEEDLSLDPPRLFLDLATAGGMIRLWILHFDQAEAARFIDARVAARGVVRFLGTARRQPGTLRFLMNSTADLAMIDPPPDDPFSLPEQALLDILAYAPHGRVDRRIHVSGVVLYAERGNTIFLKNGSVSVRVLSRQATSLRAGDLIDVAGFPVMGTYFGQLEDAIFRVRGRGELPAAHDLRSNERFKPENFEGSLVRMTAIVREKYRTQEEEDIRLEGNGELFAAVLRNPDEAGSFAGLRSGSEVRVTGILEGLPEAREIALGRGPKSFHLLLRSEEDLVVLHSGPWWTPARLKRALVIAGLGLLAGAGWVLVLRKRNEQLERRVGERSWQLAREIQARSDSKKEMRTILRERNRLAAELHDSLEQALAGAAFQLQALTANFERSETRKQHLDLTRKLLLKARQEARRSIWDLRASLLEKHGLAGAIREAARQIIDENKIACKIHVRPPAKKLSRLIEHHLLRITQEAVANSVKHAQSAQIALCLEECNAGLRLTVRDDGCGFDPATVVGPREGHFGFMGMRERVNRLGGRFEIITAPGEGTEIRVEIVAAEPELSTTAI